MLNIFLDFEVMNAVLKKFFMFVRLCKIFYSTFYSSLIFFCVFLGYDFLSDFFWGCFFILRL